LVADLQFYINLTIVYQSERETLTTRCKVHILQPLGETVATSIGLLENMGILLVKKGAALSLTESPKDLYLLNGDKLLAVAALSLGKSMAIYSGTPRYFKRFNDVQNSGWIIGRRTGGSDDRWDACTFIPNRDVRIVGAGIFESYPAAPRDLTYHHKYILSDASN